MFKIYNGKCKISSMQSGEYCWSDIPRGIGVYAVVDESEDIIQPSFLEDSSGGFLNGTDPNVPLEKLDKKWIEFKKDDEKILYIGKAGGGNNSNLRKRIKQYIRFGQGRSAPHWGGRYIWQLHNVDALYVYWKICDNPANEESELLTKFRNKHNRLPFANLKRGIKL